MKNLVNVVVSRELKLVGHFSNLVSDHERAKELEGEFVGRSIGQ